MTDKLAEDISKHAAERESIRALCEAIELQIRKSSDYQNKNSRIKQADHYPRGVNTIADMVHQKLTRIYSLLETAEKGEASDPNFESIEDSAIDAINYLSFMVSYLRGQMEGQDLDKDIFNRSYEQAKTEASCNWDFSVTDYDSGSLSFTSHATDFITGSRPDRYIIDGDLFVTGSIRLKDDGNVEISSRKFNEELNE